MTEKPHVLIVVQNLPVPLDRRVWLECQTLVAHGYDVSVICPKGPGDPGSRRCSTGSIYKYRPAPAADGALGYVVEFAYSWLRTARLSLVVWRRRPFQVLQACNPPDTYWLLARIWRGGGVKFVYDQHDLNPELFLLPLRRADPAPRPRPVLAALLWLERRTYRSADHVISTNESYRRIAMARGGRTPDGRDGRPQRPRHGAGCGRPRPPGPARSVGRGAAAATSSSTSASWARRTTSGSAARASWTSWSTAAAATDVEARAAGLRRLPRSLRRQCTDLGLDELRDVHRARRTPRRSPSTSARRRSGCAPIRRRR